MSMLEGTCHCGGVAVTVPARPDFVNACNCTLCVKLGALWGYYPAADVQITGETRPYVRSNIPAPKLSANFCPRCGATVNWSSLDPAGQTTGINMRLFEPSEIAGVELLFGDRRNHEGGSRRVYRPAATLGDGGMPQ